MLLWFICSLSSFIHFSEQYWNEQFDILSHLNSKFDAFSKQNEHIFVYDGYIKLFSFSISIIISESSGIKFFIISFLFISI